MIVICAAKTLEQMLLFFTEINVDYTGTYYAVPQQEYTQRIHATPDRSFAIVEGEVSETFSHAIENYWRGIAETKVTEALKIKVSKSASSLADYHLTMELNN